VVEHLGRQALHAATLGFEHPITGEEMLFESELPADLAGLRAALAGAPKGEIDRGAQR
jgi:23S rRNA pseudouridine1911/1915/1917 synthase